jgi:hypothetical protein
VCATDHGTAAAASTTPRPTVNTTLQLSARTGAWLADHPHAHRVVRSVWDTLTELEQAGHHAGAIAALRRVLTHHQPSSAGRCRTCRRSAWRHQRFPCMVWHQVRGELLGLFEVAATASRPQASYHVNHADSNKTPETISIRHFAVSRATSMW